MNDMTSSALILMSTFNGEKYLAEQIESIIAQTHTNWILLIRDDGSSDTTVDIIQRYSASNSRIIQIKDNFGNVNCIKSFSLLMQAACNRNEVYIFFCDQDDVWLPEKLSLQITMLQNMEQQHEAGTPMLVHSDLRVVDSNLSMTHPSFLAYERLQRNIDAPLKTLLINNYITGCTIGMNKALLTLASPVPENVLMHDWWCALCAAASGIIGFIEQVTVLYRQHNRNSIGSKGDAGKLLQLIDFKRTFARKRKNFLLCIQQADELLARSDCRNDNDRIKNFASLKRKKIMARYLLASKLKLQPAGFLRIAAFWTMLAVI